MARNRDRLQAFSVTPWEEARYRDIDFSRVQRLYFVCKGNICRSAYAEHRARALGLVAMSAGLSAPEGDPADPDAKRHARIRGVDLEIHATQPFTGSPPVPGDLVLVMEPEQARPLVASLPRDRAIQVSLLGLWARPSTRLIADPFGMGDSAFDECFAIIDASVMGVATRMWA